MNSLVKFFHEFLNPHCVHCEKQRMEELEQKEIQREVNEASKICQSCENLKMQLAIMNQLVDKLTTKEVAPTVMAENQPHKVIGPTHVPWRVRAQSLELASKLKAQELNAERAIKVPEPNKIEELESELGIESNGTAN